jgi:hypothetical protein
VLCDWNHLIWWLQWIFEERSSRDRLLLTAEWFVWKHCGELDFSHRMMILAAGLLLMVLVLEGFYILSLCTTLT